MGRGATRGERGRKRVRRAMEEKGGRYRDRGKTVAGKRSRAEAKTSGGDGSRGLRKTSWPGERTHGERRRILRRGRRSIKKRARPPGDVGEVQTAASRVGPNRRPGRSVSAARGPSSAESTGSEDCAHFGAAKVAWRLPGEARSEAGLTDRPERVGKVRRGRACQPWGDGAKPSSPHSFCGRRHPNSDSSSDGRSGNASPRPGGGPGDRASFMLRCKVGGGGGTPSWRPDKGGRTGAAPRPPLGSDSSATATLGG